MLRVWSGGYGGKRFHYVKSPLTGSFWPYNWSENPDTKDLLNLSGTMNNYRNGKPISEKIRPGFSVLFSISEMNVCDREVSQKDPCRSSYYPGINEDWITVFEGYRTRLLPSTYDGPLVLRVPSEFPDYLKSSHEIGPIQSFGFFWPTSIICIETRCMFVVDLRFTLNRETLQYTFRNRPGLVDGKNGSAPISFSVFSCSK